MADEKLNRLMRNQGSVVERTETAKALSDKDLQLAVPYSEQAKVEWERRNSAKTLSIARWALAISICSLIVAIFAAIT
jgi:hypothetical protein